jgi:hypothetical protein
MVPTRLKRALRPLADRVAPRWTERRRFLWLLEAHKQAARELVRQNGLKVSGGPFAGMTYPERAVERADQLNGASKLIGSYELELEEIVRRVEPGAYRHVINIGCAEGYYAVGLALRLPDAHVHAFDSDEAARSLCREAALANGVADRVSVGAECAVDELRSLPVAGALIVCDCEGCEGELLEPALVPGLAESDILVELHDWFVDGVSERVTERFRSTHDVTRIRPRDRDPDAFPAVAQLDAELRPLAVSEFKPREGIEWAWMTRRRG